MKTVATIRPLRYSPVRGRLGPLVPAVSTAAEWYGIAHPYHGPYVLDGKRLTTLTPAMLEAILVLGQRL